MREVLTKPPYSPRTSTHHRHLLRPLLRALLLLLTLAPLAYAIYKQWIGVSASLSAISWGRAALGTAILAAAQPLMGLIAWLVLLGLNAQQPFLKVTGLYFISQVAKYLPGGVWAFPGRVMAYQAVGVSRAASVLALVREVAALYLGAAAWGYLGLLEGLPVASWVAVTIGIGIGACGLVVLLSQTSAFWRLLARIPYFQRSSLALAVEQRPFSLVWLLQVLPVSILFWLVSGLGFRQVVLAVSPSAATLTWLQATSIFALAWCAGFVVVFAPAGLGVRESAIALLLASYLPVSQALSIALLARLWWTVAETGYIGVALAWMASTVGWKGIRNFGE